MKQGSTKEITFTCKHFQDLSLQELYQCMHLRQAVFVVEQDCPYIDADNKDQDGWHLMGWLEGQLVAYARLLPADVSFAGYSSIGRVVTDAKVRKWGFGRQLMQVANARILEKFPNHPVKISAQSYLIRFYESLGYEKTGTEYLEDGIPHIAMILK
ncbi:MAG: GNAT family N-acetyltransferase [Saprospiraceae bacterium]